MSDQRPDPDALLASLNREEQRSRRGKLKVFFGMCPGVGKTFAMLRAAQQELKDGVDLVIGVVETHGRAETEALLTGLPVIPRKEIDYKNIRITEMDLEAILARKHQVQNDEVRTLPGEGALHVPSVGGGLDLIAMSGEKLGHDIADTRIVVDDQDMLSWGVFLRHRNR